MIKGFINQIRFGNVHTGPFLDIHSVHVVHEDGKRPAEPAARDAAAGAFLHLT